MKKSIGFLIKNKNFILFVCLMLFFSLLPSYSRAETPLNELPMFGGGKLSPEQQKINDEFVKGVLEEAAEGGATTKEVIDKAIKAGIEYYYKWD